MPTTVPSPPSVPHRVHRVMDAVGLAMRAGTVAGALALLAVVGVMVGVLAMPAQAPPMPERWRSGGMSAGALDELRTPLDDGMAGRPAHLFAGVARRATSARATSARATSARATSADDRTPADGRGCALTEPVVE